MMKTLQRMTYADLLGQADDGMLHELVRGEIVRMPPPKGKHGRIEMRLGGLLNRYLDERAMALGWHLERGYDQRDRLVGAVAGGEFGIRFAVPDDPDQVRGLDVCYLSPDQIAHYEATDPDEYFPAVPALVAEVISPSERAEYINEKVNDYLAGGARLVWLLFPRTRTVQVYSPDQPIVSLRDHELLDGGEVLPGFSVSVAIIFS